jgi:hypothetical protein
MQIGTESWVLRSKEIIDNVTSVEVFRRDNDGLISKWLETGFSFLYHSGSCPEEPKIFKGMNPVHLNPHLYSHDNFST